MDKSRLFPLRRIELERGRIQLVGQNTDGQFDILHAQHIEDRPRQENIVAVLLELPGLEQFLQRDQCLLLRADHGDDHRFVVEMRLEHEDLMGLLEVFDERFPLDRIAAIEIRIEMLGFLGEDFDFELPEFVDFGIDERFRFVHRVHFGFVDEELFVGGVVIVFFLRFATAEKRETVTGFRGFSH